MQTEPWLQRDRVMIDQLHTLGIEKGKPCEPDQKMAEILDTAARTAHAWLSQQYDAGYPVMNPGIHWFPAARADVAKAVQNGYANPNTYPVDARGVTKAPAGKDPNWVPTDPHDKFELLFRLYGPQRPLFDKTWKLPDAERLTAG